MKIPVIIFCVFYFGAFGQDVKNKELKDFFSFAIDSIVRKQVSPSYTLTILDTTQCVANICGDFNCLKPAQLGNIFNESEIDSLLKGVNTKSELLLNRENVLQSSFMLESARKKGNFRRELICTVSNPIFLRSNNYCLFAWDIAGEGGRIDLYIRKNLSWTLYKTLCSWYY